MTYVSLLFYILVMGTVALYYALPIKRRWVALVLANAIFILAFHRTGWWIFLITILFSYAMSFLINRFEGALKKVFLIAGIVGVLVPWSMAKYWSVVIAIGVSFYSLQLISYLVDIYRDDIEPQKNIFKFFLFISFFPQIIQGPIPRYSQLSHQLIEGHLFDEEKFCRGFYLIIWGFFLKWMIADKAKIIVDTVFNQQPAYSGAYVWVAGILYSIQLYADFRGCTTISRGVSLLFGIELVDNFNHPYLASSVKDFWRRWHMSLSIWLRDYIYIPLGGNRKGNIRKYVNILITF